MTDRKKKLIFHAIWCFPCHLPCHWSVSLITMMSMSISSIWFSNLHYILMLEVNNKKKHFPSSLLVFIFVKTLSHLYIFVFTICIITIIFFKKVNLKSQKHIPLIHHCPFSSSFNIHPTCVCLSFSISQWDSFNFMIKVILYLTFYW